MLKPMSDQVRAARAHGIRTPAELRNKAVMDPLVSRVTWPPWHALIVLQERAVVEEWFSGCEDTDALV